MAAPAVGMIVATSFLGRCNNQRILNTIHYRMDVAFDSPDLETFYQEFTVQMESGGAFDIETAYLACHSGTYFLDFIRQQVVYPTRFRGFDFTISANGTQPGDATAQNVSAVLTKQVELSGRSKIGSIHIGGLSAGDYGAGLIGVGLATRLATLKLKLLSQIAQDQGPGICTPVLYHPLPNANPKFDYLTNLKIQETLRTNRTRNVGKGE